MIRFTFRRAVAAGVALLISTVAASAELREALPGTKYEWECTGDFSSYTETIVEGDANSLVKDATANGKPWSRTWRPSWLRGSGLYRDRKFSSTRMGRRVVDYDWDQLRGFERMEVGWSRSGTMNVRGNSRGRDWTDSWNFSVAHTGREMLNSPVYGEIEVVRTETNISYGSGGTNNCVALVFPGDAAQVEYECKINTPRTNWAASCKLVDRY